MDINYDCVRALMLSIENKFDNGKMPFLISTVKIPGFSSDEIDYNSQRLAENNYFVCDVKKPLQINGKKNTIYKISALSEKGHKLVYAIRDDEKWKQIKDKLSEHKTHTFIDLENAINEVAN